MLNVELSIDDFNVEQNSTTLVVTLGESCVLNGITIGWLLYTKAPHGFKLITSWQKDYTCTNFTLANLAPVEVIGFTNASWVFTAMLQTPDSQIRSLFYAKNGRGYGVADKAVSHDWLRSLEVRTR